MTRDRLARRRTWLLAVAVGVACLGPLPAARAAKEGPLLADAEYWRIVTTFSEPPGGFPSDNLLSNEDAFQRVIPELTRAVAPGGVYLGVGPEQNFTYIAAVQPRLAFIIDIRRGNLDLHLLYKALFELSDDRVEFLSRLFSRPRPEGLSADDAPARLFDAYADAGPSRALYADNVRAVIERLAGGHGFALGADDLLRIQHVYRAFFRYGPDLQYSSTRSLGQQRGREPTYRDLMLETDGAGRLRSYLASEETFQYLKVFETDNRLVPLVGDFAGERAIRAIGDFLDARRETVTAFYVSNVEEYLRGDGRWDAFCANVAALPIDASSTFIRTARNEAGLPYRLSSSLALMGAELAACR